MNILLTINNNYVKPCISTLLSLNKTTPTFKNIFIAYWDDNPLTTYNQSLIKKTVRTKCKIVFFSIPRENIFCDIDCGSFNEIILLRIIALQALPSSVHKVLYIDSDIIIKGDITCLYKENLDGFIICGATEKYDNTSERIKRLGISDGLYLNSGFLLINVDAYKQYYHSFLEILNKYKSVKLEFPDQDLINLFFDKRKLCFAKDIMYCPYVGWSVPKNSYVIHYIGKIKPWNLDYQGFMYGIRFWRYGVKSFGYKIFIRWFLLNMKRRIALYGHFNRGR